jgi:hypothetical protein
MRRCAQHNLNEYDPMVLDIESWIRYWESLKINALVLTAGGLMAFYPTRLPNHHKGQFLNDRDVFGDYLKSAKRRGIRVVARIETNWLHAEVLKTRPEWFERSEDGSPAANEESQYVYHSCLFSTYYEEQVPTIIREIASLYDVDGFFTNSWPETGAPHACYCAACQKFGKRNAMQLLTQYQARSRELCEYLKDAVKGTGADHVYNLNIAGGIHAVQNIKSLAETGEWITADHQGRSGGFTPIWDCSQQGRVGYASMGNKPVANVVTANAHNWRHTSKIQPEMELWLAQTAASGMIPWLVWMGSEVEDPRWRGSASTFYQFLAANERHFVNLKPMSSLGVVYSQRSNYLYDCPGAVPGGYGARTSDRRAPPGDPGDYLQGLYYALLEGRFVFDFVHEDNLNAANLKNYSTLLLPNIALLSDQQCEALRTFVASGGSILATFETGLYDEFGRQRKEPGLSDIFGIERAGDRQGAFCYAERRQSHELLNGFDGTKWLPLGEWILPLKSDSGSVLTLVPPYPRGIPELVYAHQRIEMPYAGPHSDIPGVVLRERGKSRIAYFPSDIDRCTWRYGNTDLSGLLQNAIRWTTRDSAEVKVSGDGVAEVIAWETEPGCAIHILNYNNPNMTLPWIRKDCPIGPQRVQVTLRPGVRVSGIKLLRSGLEVHPQQEGRLIEFTIPSIKNYEVAAISFV